MPTKINYFPGVCNIGPAEIRLRRRTGIIAFLFTFILWIILHLSGVPHVWKLLLFFPATLSALGYLQAQMHFCATYGLLGVFNFGSKTGSTASIERWDYRRQDQIKAIQIIFLSTLTGIIVALVGYSVFR